MRDDHSLIGQLFDEFRQNPPRPCIDCESDEVLFDFAFDLLSSEDAKRVEAHRNCCEYTRWEIMKLQTKRAITQEALSKRPLTYIADVLGPKHWNTLKKFRYVLKR